MAKNIASEKFILIACSRNVSWTYISIIISNVFFMQYYIIGTDYHKYHGHNWSKSVFQNILLVHFFLDIKGSQVRRASLHSGLIVSLPYECRQQNSSLCKTFWSVFKKQCIWYFGCIKIMILSYVTLGLIIPLIYMSMKITRQTLPSTCCK